jgi:hypothetical protein
LQKARDEFSRLGGVGWIEVKKVSVKKVEEALDF